MKAVEGDPWADAATSFPIGSTVHGTVERVAAFGVFVQVGPGITALLPGSESGHPRGEDLSRHFRPGDNVTATVLSVDPDERRMSLSVTAASEAEARRDVDQWRGKQSGGGFGTFADLFANIDTKK